MWYEVVVQALEPRYAFFVGALMFMGFDIVTGLIKAFATNSFTSTKVKQGIFHKSALIIIVLMGVCIDVLTCFIPSLPFSSPLTQAVCVLIIGMEVMSCLENVVAINPTLKDSEVIKRLLPNSTDKEV